MKKLINIIIAFFFTLTLFAQQNESPVDEYTKVITGRADQIVKEMTFESENLKVRVRDIIVGHYRFLNDAEEARNADVAKIREEFADNKDLKNAKIDLRKAEQELKIRDHHFAFVSQLKYIISEDQIDQVKDGLTYGVLQNTYNGYCDMIPQLNPEEKEQILFWLTEAREHAIDGGTSKEKHGWFGKYKGRINNYLSAKGYDLKKLSTDWEEGLKAKGIKL
ncbi:MAG: DUF3826 domain-containing protein [Prolixibacteraceae bacterium]